jgi:hydroxymethylpyrimidine/phosphomethylpyrimidine kinase
MIKHTCLSIAGFDGSGGAGMQADLKTFSAYGCYGMNILTALPVQNTCGVRRCYDIPLQCIDDQLHAIFEDITPDSIKIGMLFSSPIIELVANFLQQHAPHIPIILDPVMVAKSGDLLLQKEAIDTLKSRLIPLTTIITPNIPEAYTLIAPLDDLDELAARLLSLGSQAVLLKGGHADGAESNDLFLDKSGARYLLKSPRIDSKNTHGTGCTLSAAICAGMALGFPMIDACRDAKHYLYQAMLSSQQHSVGKGHGPVDHFYHQSPRQRQLIQEN